MGFHVLVEGTALEIPRGVGYLAYEHRGGLEHVFHDLGDASRVRMGPEVPTVVGDVFCFAYRSLAGEIQGFDRVLEE